MADVPPPARVTLTLDRERALVLDAAALRQAELRLRALTGNPRLTAFEMLNDLRRGVGLTELTVLLWAALRREDPTLTEEQVNEFLTIDRIPAVIDAVRRAVTAFIAPAAEQEEKADG